MKKRYYDILRKITHKHILNFKIEKQYTNAKMAELLSIDDRSYIDLDHGKAGCSALTLTLFLIYCCPDANKFLEEIRSAFESEADEIA